MKNTILEADYKQFIEDFENLVNDAYGSEDDIVYNISYSLMPYFIKRFNIESNDFFDNVSFDNNSVFIPINAILENHGIYEKSKFKKDVIKQSYK